MYAAPNELKPLWDYACARIKAAEAIVFLGYSFPVSDAKARGVLLGAIATNTYSSGVKHLRFHIVLGSDTRAAQRLSSLLTHAAESSGRSRQYSYEVVEQSLYVEDFLSVFDRSRLLPKK